MAANQKWHKWEVVIPADVSCKHCILQVCFYSNMASLVKSWPNNPRVPRYVDALNSCFYQVDWKTGNQGRCIDLVDCPGKMQEHFVTCSDIRIKGGVTTPGQKGKIIIDLRNMQAYVII